jgi:hypothetical protein
LHSYALRAFPILFTHVLGLLLPQLFYHRHLWRFGPVFGAMACPFTERDCNRTSFTHNALLRFACISYFVYACARPSASSVFSSSSSLALWARFRAMACPFTRLVDSWVFTVGWGGGWQPHAHSPYWMGRVSLCLAPRSKSASSVLLK